MITILLIGSGGREHALAWKLSESQLCQKLYIAPGNPGTELHGENVVLDLYDFPSVKKFVAEKGINMVVVGPEEPLVRGLGDFFNSEAELKDVIFIGPGQDGAQLEGSKAFAKAFMQRHDIPTAAYGAFTRDSLAQAKDFLKSLKAPYVLKADGLAAGKGVIICQSLTEAEKTLEEMLCERKFGDASSTVVIEEFLKGIELSVFVLTDGKDYKLLPSAKDYKRIGEGDSGPNTGGMGAISPVPFADQAFMEKVEQRIVAPTINGLKQDNIPYTGFIFFGLMNVDGDPFVIEYNVRMGDPETEAVIPRIESDLVELLEACGKKRLGERTISFKSETSATVMLVSGGYPGSFNKGYQILNVEKSSGSILFYAGMKKQDSKLLTSGGRVLAITSLGNDIDAALEKSYRNADLIDFFGKYFRRDIGFDLSE